MINLNEAQETVRLRIMLNPLNRLRILEAREVLKSKIKETKGHHDGQPLLGTIQKLIKIEDDCLTTEERIRLEVAMYMEALDEKKRGS